MRRRSSLVICCRREPPRSSSSRLPSRSWGDFVSGAFEVLEVEGSVSSSRTGRHPPGDGTSVPLRVRKSFSFGAEPTACPRWTRRGCHQCREPLRRGAPGIEWALNMLGGAQPAAWYARRSDPRVRCTQGGDVAITSAWPRLCGHRAGVAPQPLPPRGGRRSRPSPCRRAASRATTRVAACCDLAAPA